MPTADRNTRTSRRRRRSAGRFTAAEMAWLTGTEQTGGANRFAHFRLPGYCEVDWARAARLIARARDYRVIGEARAAELHAEIQRLHRRSTD